MGAQITDNIVKMIALSEVAGQKGEKGFGKRDKMQKCDC